jgi:hypothetical protein
MAGGRIFQILLPGIVQRDGGGGYLPLSGCLPVSNETLRPLPIEHWASPADQGVQRIAERLVPKESFDMNRTTTTPILAPVLTVRATLQMPPENDEHGCNSTF